MYYTLYIAHQPVRTMTQSELTEKIRDILAVAAGIPVDYCLDADQVIQKFKQPFLTFKVKLNQRYSYTHQRRTQVAPAVQADDPATRDTKINYSQQYHFDVEINIYNGLSKERAIQLMSAATPCAQLASSAGISMFFGKGYRDLTELEQGAFASRHYIEIPIMAYIDTFEHIELAGNSVDVNVV